jgi:hypothetical protein
MYLNYLLTCVTILMYRYYGSWYHGDIGIPFPKNVFRFHPLLHLSLALYCRIFPSKVCNMVYESLFFMHIHTCNTLVIVSFIYHRYFDSIYLCNIFLVEYTRLLCWFPFEYMLLAFRQF